MLLSSKLCMWYHKCIFYSHNKILSYLNINRIIIVKIEQNKIHPNDIKKKINKKTLSNLLLANALSIKDCKIFEDWFQFARDGVISLSLDRANWGDNKNETLNN